MRADRTQIIGSLNEPDCLAGITLQSGDDLSHFFIKGETVTVPPVILYTQKMMRAFNSKGKKGKKMRSMMNGGGMPPMGGGFPGF